MTHGPDRGDLAKVTFYTVVGDHTGKDKMAAAQPQSAPQPKAKTSVQVRVLDSLGEMFFGARIDFSIHGALAGRVIDSAGKATITYPELETELEVVVSAMNSTESRLLLSGVDIKPGSTQNFVDFRLPIRRSTNMPPQPTAKCPDGTSGQPCVNCPLGGSTIRVCG
jgi:hypothetical protein